MKSSFKNWILEQLCLKALDTVCKCPWIAFKSTAAGNKRAVLSGPNKAACWVILARWFPVWIGSEPPSKRSPAQSQLAVKIGSKCKKVKKGSGQRKCKAEQMVYRWSTARRAQQWCWKKDHNKKLIAEGWGAITRHWRSEEAVLCLMSIYCFMLMDERTVCVRESRVHAKAEL